MRSKDGIRGCTAAISPIDRRITQRAKHTVDLTAFAALHESRIGADFASSMSADTLARTGFYTTKTQRRHSDDRVKAGGHHFSLPARSQTAKFTDSGGGK